MNIINAGGTINLLCYKYSENADQQTVLCDRTLIDGVTWANLKPKAMADNYEQEQWYIDLNMVQRRTLEDLRKAQ